MEIITLLIIFSFFPCFSGARVIMVNENINTKIGLNKISNLNVYISDNPENGKVNTDIEFLFISDTCGNIVKHKGFYTSLMIERDE